MRGHGWLVGLWKVDNRSGMTYSVLNNVERNFQVPDAQYGELLKKQSLTEILPSTSQPVAKEECVVTGSALSSAL